MTGAFCRSQLQLSSVQAGKESPANAPSRFLSCPAFPGPWHSAHVQHLPGSGPRHCRRGSQPHYSPPRDPLQQVWREGQQWVAYFVGGGWLGVVDPKEGAQHVFLRDLGGPWSTMELQAWPGFLPKKSPFCPANPRTPATTPPPPLAPLPPHPRHSSPCPLSCPPAPIPRGQQVTATTHHTLLHRIRLLLAAAEGPNLTAEDQERLLRHGFQDCVLADGEWGRWGGGLGLGGGVMVFPCLKISLCAAAVGASGCGGGEEGGWAPYRAACPLPHSTHPEPGDTLLLLGR